MKFEIYKDSQNLWRFRLKAQNGKVIATGESYKRRGGVLKTIRAIKGEFACFDIQIFEDGKETQK